MNLGEFHEDLAAALGRGASLDNRIPGWVTEAANLLETGYTFSWMKKSADIDLDPNAVVPNRVDLPSDRIKAIEFVRVQQTGSDGSVMFGEPLAGVDELSVLSIDIGAPSGFWLDSEYLWLDARPDTATRLRMRYYEYTEWPVDMDASPSMLNRGFSALKCQSLITAARDLRDVRLGQIYVPALQQALAALTDAEDQGQYKHLRQLRMVPRG